MKTAPAEITREIMWNVEGAGFPYAHVLMYLGAACALALFVWVLFKGGFITRMKMWKLGGAPDENRLTGLVPRLRWLILDVLLHRKLLRKPLMGVVHLLLFWGFLVLLAATTLILIEVDVLHPLLGITFIKGNFYLIFSLAADLAGGGALVAVAIALARRHLFRPKWLDHKIEDSLVLWVLLVILVTGFAVEGLRMWATELQPGHHMAAYVWFSPVGRIFALPMIWLSVDVAQSLHRIVWWLHMIVAMGGGVYIAWSKLLHIFTTPPNILLRSANARPSLRVIPQDAFENSETFGIHNVEEFSWKDLYDTEACMRCSRCTEVCPAYQTEKPLDPREVVQNIRQHLEKKAGTAIGKDGNAKKLSDEEYTGPKLVGDTVSKDAIWSCTTCSACVDACPAYIQQFPKLIDFRRYLVMMESDFPEELNDVFKGMENNSNPWALGAQQMLVWFL